MYNKNYLSIQPRQSCIASFQILYGIGKVKATKLNTFLLYHPTQSRFTVHFNDILYPTRGLVLFSQIPIDTKIRLCVENHMRKKILIFCYQMFRLFQNLPTKGQRTRANGNSISNHNPYTSLRINISFYQSLEVAYKKRELLYNARYDELNAFIEAQTQKEKMKKEDKRANNKKARQEYIKNQKKK